MTEKEKLVVIEWLNNGFNGTRAYMKYYKRAKESSASVKFSNLMKRDDVIDYKNSLLESMESSEVASANEILMYLTRVMRGQERDAFGLDPSLDDRTKAAEKLMKAKGMFTQKVELSGKQMVQIIDDINESD